MAQATKKRTAGSFRISAAISFWLYKNMLCRSFNHTLVCVMSWRIWTYGMSANWLLKRKITKIQQCSCREYILSCPNKCYGSFERTVISRKTLISIYSIGGIADFLYTFDKARKTITVKQRCHSAFLSPLCKRLMNFITLKKPGCRSIWSCILLPVCPPVCFCPWH